MKSLDEERGGRASSGKKLGKRREGSDSKERKGMRRRKNTRKTSQQLKSRKVGKKKRGKGVKIGAWETVTI